ncbi:MAG TPA: TIGR03118 family protein [Pyrinomonadaceae bacterium]|nr:TIGR03118 family protein [Pyrinomonadaceae bacterium]
MDNTRLSAPWGIALAPANFGHFSNTLVVGNFGRTGGIEGASINAFNPSTGAYAGTMVDEGGSTIQINKLWSLVFGNGVNGGDPNTLYFTAGIFSEKHGLFGSRNPGLIRR